MYRQRFFDKHFGKRTKIFWLPDSFGYSSQVRNGGCSSRGDRRNFISSSDYVSIATASPQAFRLRLFLHPKAVLEQHQQIPPHNLLLGRH